MRPVKHKVPIRDRSKDRPVPTRLTKKLVREAVSIAAELSEAQSLRVGSITRHGIEIQIDRRPGKNEPYYIVAVSTSRSYVILARDNFNKLSMHGKRFWIIWAILLPIFKSNYRKCDKYALLALFLNFDYVNVKSVGRDFLKVIMEFYPKDLSVERTKQMMPLLKQARGLYQPAIPFDATCDSFVV